MNNTYITFETKNNGKIDMSRDSLIRWLCLMEVMHVTEQKAEELNINLNNFDWIKPIAFSKYIEERKESMDLDLKYDETNNLFGNHIVHYGHQPEAPSIIPAVD